MGGVKVDPHSVELVFTLTADFLTRYLIQVHNYYPGFLVSYSLAPEGIAEAAVAPAAAGGAAQHPALLVDLAEGSVPGLRHGSFDYFRFYHPGGKPIWIVTTQTYGPLRRFTSRFGAGSDLTGRESLHW